MDLCGPMRTESINGKKYILVIVDDYTRFGWVRFLRSKDETPQVIEKFIVKTQRALNATVRFVRTDNGTEFVNKTLDGWFESVGISHETSVPRSPQQNGVVERRNRTLMEAARTMLIFAKAPLFLWAEAVATACYTLNRSLVHTLHGKTYYELLKGKKPNLQYFRVFGSLCYPTNDYDDVGKLKAKADIGLAPQQMTSVQNSTELELTALQSGRSRSALVKDPEPPSVPPTKKQASAQMDFQIKLMNMRRVENKSSLVAKGYRQKLVFDFEEIICPVARLEAINSSLLTAQAKPTEMHLTAIKRIFRRCHDNGEVLLFSSFLDIDLLAGQSKKAEKVPAISTIEANNIAYQDVVLKSSGCVLNSETMDLRSTKFRCIVTIKVLLLYAVIVFNTRAPSTLISVITLSKSRLKGKLLSCISWRLNTDQADIFNEALPERGLRNSTPTAWS
ncbi:retrovirus-related pol polyprotein from transposon TNT 1-94 [Tanacetum coccineum]